MLSPRPLPCSSEARTSIRGRHSKAQSRGASAAHASTDKPGDGKISICRTPDAEAIIHAILGTLLIRLSVTNVLLFPFRH